MEGNRIFKQNLKPVIRMRKTIFCDAAVKLTLNIVKTINKLKSWLENVMKGCVLCSETISKEELNIIPSDNNDPDPPQYLSEKLWTTSITHCLLTQN